MNSTELNPQIPTGMSTRGMRVLIAEDEALAANVIEYELDVIGAEIVGRATDGRQAATLTQRLRPDLVLMDAEMPEVDGLAAAGEIQECCPTPLVYPHGLFRTSNHHPGCGCESGRLPAQTSPCRGTAKGHARRLGPVCRSYRIAPIKRGAAECAPAAKPFAGLAADLHVLP
jgi:hypothetical protein